jgi:sulfur-carrier protein
MVKLVYFAWVRERIGKPSEEVTLPDGLATVADLVAWQAGRGEEYAHAFASPATIRVALDQQHARPADELGHPREIAFFPPMTGG